MGIYSAAATVRWRKRVQCQNPQSMIKTPTINCVMFSGAAGAVGTVIVALPKVVQAWHSRHCSHGYASTFTHTYLLLPLGTCSPSAFAAVNASPIRIHTSSEDVLRDRNGWFVWSTLYGGGEYCVWHFVLCNVRDVCQRWMDIGMFSMIRVL